MTRVTFLAFVLPVMTQVFLLCLQIVTGDGSLSRSRWLWPLLRPICTGSFFLLSMMAADASYFQGNMKQFVLTPYNNLLYNLSTTNLATHGLHPRWLHIVVNLPLVVGPGLVLYGLAALRRVLMYGCAKGKESPQTRLNRSTCYA